MKNNDLEELCTQLANMGKQLDVMKRYVFSKVHFEQEIENLRNMKRVHELNSDDWLRIEIYLNDSARGFMFSFRDHYPNLKEKDLQLCMLIKLDFNNSELTHFYGISAESVKHKLLILKSKLGIEKSHLSAREYIKMWVSE